MPVPSHAEERVRQAYELLRDLLEQDADSSPRESAIAYLPPLPPIDPGSRLSEMCIRDSHRSYCSRPAG